MYNKELHDHHHLDDGSGDWRTRRATLLVFNEKREREKERILNFYRVRRNDKTWTPTSSLLLSMPGMKRIGKRMMSVLMYSESTESLIDVKLEKRGNRNRHGKRATRSQTHFGCSLHWTSNQRHTQSWYTRLWEKEYFEETRQINWEITLEQKTQKHREKREYWMENVEILFLLPSCLFSCLPWHMTRYFLSFSLKQPVLVIREF